MFSFLFNVTRGLNLRRYGIPLHLGPTAGYLELDLSLRTARFMIHAGEIGLNLLGFGIRLNFSCYFKLDWSRRYFHYVVRGVISLQELWVVLHFSCASGNIEWDLNHGFVRILVRGFLTVLPLLDGNNTGPYWTFCLQIN